MLLYSVLIKVVLSCQYFVNINAGLSFSDAGLTCNLGN